MDKIQLKDPAKSSYSLISSIYEELMHDDEYPGEFTGDQIFDKLCEEFKISGEYLEGIFTSLEELGVFEEADLVFMSFVLLTCHMTHKGSTEIPNWGFLKKQNKRMLDILGGQILLCDHNGNPYIPDKESTEKWKEVKPDMPKKAAKPVAKAAVPATAKKAEKPVAKATKKSK